MLLFSLVHAQDIRVSNPLLPVVSFSDYGTEGLEVHYRAGSLTEVGSEIHEGLLWKQISIPGYQPSRAGGKPQLPVHTELVVVPAGASYDWTHTTGSTEALQGYRIYPTLAPATDRYGDPEPVFGYDPVVYHTDAYYPANPVTVTSVQEFRGMTLVWFEISPVQYNPVTGAIKLHHDLTLEMSFSGARQFLHYPDHSAHFLGNFSLTALNAGSIQREIAGYLDGAEALGTVTPSSYIILTDTLFLAAAGKLADWKRQLGFSVEVVSGGGWTFNAMKNEVQSRYQQWTPKPDYVLVIGDHDRMPAQMVINPDNEQYGTDLHLVTMGGGNDYVPEMARGRLSVTSAAQAMTVVDKIIQYEKNPPTDSAFYATGLNCAQFQDDDFNNFEDRRFVHTSEEVRDYLTTKGYDIKRVYYADLTSSTPQYYNPSYYSAGQPLPAALTQSSFSWGGGPSQILSQINSGVFYVLHRDHGYAGGSGWHAPNFVTSHVSMLNNGTKTPVVFSINCHTGEFTLSECFAERFQRHANGGAVGVVAASYYSYSGWNDGLTAGIFDAIWASPGLVPAFGAGGIFSPANPSHPNIRNLGFVMNHGLLRMTQTWSSSPVEAQYTYRLFHYFGDPAMRIRTAVPTQLTAQHNDSVVCGAPGFTVSGVNLPEATATLTIPGKIIGSAVLVNGSCTIPTTPYAAPWLLLTVSAPEGIPYTDTIWVIPGPLSVTVQKQDVKCHGKAEGAIEITISCGVSPAAISWAHGPTSASLSQLPAGTYHYVVTDANNDSIIDSVIISEPSSPLLVNASITPVLCYYGANGSIQTNVSGGVPPYVYKWGNNTTGTSLTNLPAGSYALTITDGVGCIRVDTFVVTQPQPLKVDADIIHDMTNTCTGQATALPSGGTAPYTYLWNDPSAQTNITATGLCPGLVRVTVTDHNGCMAIKAFNIYNTSGLEDIGQPAPKIFPNPVTSQTLFVELPASEPTHQILTAEIYNSSGQLISRYVVLPEDRQIVITPFPEAIGLYHLIIRRDDYSILIAEKIARIRSL
ncbi:MAG TPA: C25 family cysteine peptidase [Bacteroidales bacterium]|nr:C25 family cysteine peptidase [Bacteroidales bacterium]HRZ48592.1 C25 family cysteine peptidase [Bacteroidales bacterium]